MRLRVLGFPKCFMKKRISVYFLIITICLLHLLVPDLVFGQAVQVFTKYKYTFEHPDIHEFFPDVLNAFKNPKKGVFRNPVLIERFAYEPKYILRLYADTHDNILIRLLLDEQFQDLFKDSQFHALVKSSTQIDELVRLIRQATPRERGDGCEPPPPPEPPKATTLSIVSGFGQNGKPGSPLDELFIVEVRDQQGKPFSGATVNFTVEEGEGRLSQRTARTGANGQASVTLTLGAEAGQNRVMASVVGISLTQTFTATAIATDEPPKPTTLTKVSGDDQQGQIETRLSSPFVVEVRDQYGDPLSGATVNFTVEAGGGSRFPTMPTTNALGRASTRLTLGAEAGENRVVASVEGISQTQAFMVTAIDADVNDDGVVSIIDLSIVFSLMVDPERSIDGVDADINDDKIVNYKDFFLILSMLEPAASAPSVQALVQGDISAADIRALLIQSKALPEATQADPVYQRGIIALERLLATLTEVPVVPKQTALLVNYPNPFNPETWIPYQLSEASDVTVSIYAVDGSLIRTLALGHQPAGLYQRKSRAAYWDGRNAFGERVASGLYFYTLTAGDFTATRKMLIRK